MGRRSRKRLSDSSERALRAREASDRPRPAVPAGPPVPRRRARLGEAPPAPWSPFPLVELCILIGIVLIVVGLASHGARQRVVFGCGLSLVALSALELSIREHFSGYRSHTTLLAGAATVLAEGLVVILLSPTAVVVLIVAVGVFALCWPLLRGAFRRRTGGLGFRA